MVQSEVKSKSFWPCTLIMDTLEKQHVQLRLFEKYWMEVISLTFLTKYKTLPKAFTNKKSSIFFLTCCYFAAGLPFGFGIESDWTLKE